MGWKYIVFQVKETKFPIIFPDKLIHKDVARIMRRAIPGGIAEVVSAGMLNSLDVITDKVLGSESLGINCGPDDEKLINGYQFT